MTELILYLLESSAALAVLYLLYAVLLRKETFFGINRFFLLGALVFSCLFPLVSFNLFSSPDSLIERPVRELSNARISYYEALANWTHQASSGMDDSRRSNTSALNATSGRDYHNQILIGVMILYFAGVLAFVFRLGWIFASIGKLLYSNPIESINGVKVVKITQRVAPFSFINYVFIHKEMIGSEEFAQILKHEKTHIRQKHSVDLIFVQLLAAFLWFNPVIWLLFKSLKENHEYIADKKMINQGYSLVEYQTLLLRQLISNNSYGLVHNFNLSFIKKRITMMKNNKSGWSGKVKVAMAIACTLIISVIIVQCNSRIDEQISLDNDEPSTAQLTGVVNLPVLPETDYHFQGDLDNALDLAVTGNKLTVNGEFYEVDEIGSVIEKSGFPENGAIALRIDRHQSMSVVRDVFAELRKADRRKVLYIGQTSADENVEMPFLLPPSLENAAKHGWEAEPDMLDLEAQGKIDILKIDLGDNAGPANQQEVYDFVKSHIQKGSSDYVVSARFDDDDTYGDYLRNLTYIMEGFHQIFQERSQKMFGKNFYDTNKEEYRAVRKGVPQAISIAD